jgi:hypothetical protein
VEDDMQLNLSPEEAVFLTRHLNRHIEAVDAELIHTDKRQLQRELAAELAKLKELQERLKALPAD